MREGVLCGGGVGAAACIHIASGSFWYGAAVYCAVVFLIALFYSPSAGSTERKA